MEWVVGKSSLKGNLLIPASKSHTIRALLIATLAKGRSEIRSPLMQGDGRSALNAAGALGADVRWTDDTVSISGLGGDLSGGDENLFMGNSGTGTRLFAGAASLGSRPRRFDGDMSLRSRPMKPLLQAIRDLGGDYTLERTDGDVPFVIRGPLQGGETNVSGITSQYVSSLLLCAPLAPHDTTIIVEDLHEKPYVELTLWWLKKMGVEFSVSEDMTRFEVKGRSGYRAINERIPGDFSSATFGAVAAAATASEVTLKNLDFTDPQGDKRVFEILERMGMQVSRSGKEVTLKSGSFLRGGTFDINDMPDSIAALAVLGCCAEGETRLINVAQARIKETDRIKVMAGELTKMGADIHELSDGLVIRKSRLTGARVDSHDDHRVAMALALAGMAAEGETIIEKAECAEVTYATFQEDFVALGAKMDCRQER